LLFGAVVPTLAQPSWDDGRKTAGGSWLGLSLGVVSGAAAARAFAAQGSEVAVPAVAGLAGLGVGVGTGLLWPGEGSQPARIGAVAGPAVFMAASMLAERKLHLADGLGPAAFPLAVTGAAAGAGYG
jgi:hypothetical protein